MFDLRKVLIIAEAGVNHNGRLNLAYRLVDAAVEARADVVKFQTFKASQVISCFAEKAEYQKQTTSAVESQLEMVKKLELDRSAHEELIAYCQDKGIEFLSTPFDTDSIDLLVELGLETLKIPSGEITNLPYLRRIGCLKKNLIMSTGMATLDEVRTALELLINAGTEKGQITLLHCNTEYPTPFEDVNLRAMCTMREELGVNVGYSDHTPGIEVPIAAAALGAQIIEKHFTLDRDMEGPDHKASLQPDELKAMVRAIRNIEKALGDGFKRPSPSELKNKPIVRKSIVAAREIKKGEVLTEKNVGVKRLGSGTSPMKWDKVIGQKAIRDFLPDELIELHPNI